ncbi:MULTISPECIES: NAD(P)/FAD-dependent oxidoreductase [Streptococcus]|uniref:FAD-dependent oxidoreductase n=2 Tax=Streptococcus TaxID=1301 RepID=A0A7X1RMP3_STRMT|nr:MULTISPECIES: FAD-dependent oxidoreductase [Streptococcus]MDI1473106.1 FAD-dependent oxidoreductase [Streptococcus sp. ST22-14]MQQ51966.1 FAD-dependent oxidoreductase [Streptococcus mitis]
MKKVAIVGAGIVGATAAYYLSKEADIEVTVFDHGYGQATKAAAGIISPWFSKRRNKAWYKMARLGADFYVDLLADLEKTGQKVDFYQRSGVFLLKKDDSKLEELYDLALQRRDESPLIGELAILDQAAASSLFPGLKGFERLLYASGGARVDGQLLVGRLLEASQVKVVKKEVSLTPLLSGYQIDNQMFDQVILSTGAWLGHILEPLGYEVDVRPQKGQLRDYQVDLDMASYSVVMPEGEWDLIPFPGGKLSLGATHENDMGFDLTVDETLLDQMVVAASPFYPALAEAISSGERVGIRAYTSDFSPFFGQVPNLSGVYTASGLGSSGLTTGPIIGYHLAQMLQGRSGVLDPADYPTERYIKKKQ